MDVVLIVGLLAFAGLMFAVVIYGQTGQPVKNLLENLSENCAFR